jgi:hypothetical protein
MPRIVCHRDSHGTVDGEYSLSFQSCGELARQASTMSVFLNFKVCYGGQFQTVVEREDG